MHLLGYKLTKKLPLPLQTYSSGEKMNFKRGGGGMIEMHNVYPWILDYLYRTPDPYIDLDAESGSTCTLGTGSWVDAYWSV